MSFTLAANISSSVCDTACTGAASTVTRAVASCAPPGPFAVRRYVVEACGVTDCDPLGSTLPMPSILTSFAFSVRHVSVVGWPGVTLSGLAESDAVGAAGGGGGGGGGAVSFFLQPPTTNNAAITNNNA